MQSLISEDVVLLCCETFQPIIDYALNLPKPVNLIGSNLIGPCFFFFFLLSVPCLSVLELEQSQRTHSSA